MKRSFNQFFFFFYFNLQQNLCRSKTFADEQFVCKSANLDCGEFRTNWCCRMRLKRILCISIWECRTYRIRQSVSTCTTHRHRIKRRTNTLTTSCVRLLYALFCQAQLIRSSNDHQNCCSSKLCSIKTVWNDLTSLCWTRTIFKFYLFFDWSKCTYCSHHHLLALHLMPAPILPTIIIHSPLRNHSCVMP